MLGSFAIALIAGFAGLSLTRGAAQLAVPVRKLVVSASAVILGWGIWSMHFVAMLGLQLPVLVYYDPLITLISALIAILVTGLALVLVHFGQRTTTKIVAAGATLGLGIAAMHYVGMSGIEVCRPVYSLVGILTAISASIALSIMSFLISYGTRSRRGILLGVLGFAVAVFAVHFIAMSGTGFVLDEGTTGTGPRLSNEVLAFGVALSAFVLSGASLLTGATFAEADAPAAPEPDPAPLPVAEPPEPTPPVAEAPDPRLPYEANAKTHFIDAQSVSAIRAEGHYTVLYAGKEKLFCPWSITEAEARVRTPGFIRTHRSYLVNTAHVTSFERKKDNGVCYFENTEALTKAPVSRSRLPEVQELLGV